METSTPTSRSARRRRRIAVAVIAGVGTFGVIGASAASLGGITTVLDMPLNSVPSTTTPQALAAVAVMGIVTSGLAYWLNLRVLSQITPVAAMSSCR